MRVDAVVQYTRRPARSAGVWIGMVWLDLARLGHTTRLDDDMVPGRPELHSGVWLRNVFRFLEFSLLRGTYDYPRCGFFTSFLNNLATNSRIIIIKPALIIIIITASHLGVVGRIAILCGCAEKCHTANMRCEYYTGQNNKPAPVHIIPTEKGSVRQTEASKAKGRNFFSMMMRRRRGARQAQRWLTG